MFSVLFRYLPPIQKRLPYLIAGALATVLPFFAVGCGGPAEAEKSPEEQVEQGIRFLTIFDFDQAYQTLSEVQPLIDEDSELWPRATYALAISAWHKSPPDLERINAAKALLESLIEADPQSKIAAMALLDIGRVLEVSDNNTDTTDVDAARTYYRQVRENYPGTSLAQRATLYLAQTLVQTFEVDRYKEAIDMLEAEIEADPDGEWVALFAHYIAIIYINHLEDYEAAIEPYLLAREKGIVRDSQADRYLWQLGKIALEVGRDMVAADVFTEIVVDYPRSEFGTLARERVIELSRKYPEANLTVPDLAEIKFER